MLAMFCIAFVLPIGIASYPKIKSFFTPDENALAFPDFAQLNSDFRDAKADRIKRTQRILDGTDSVDSAMERLANHEFIAPEQMSPVSGWIMTSGSGAQFHRATLQRQSQIFIPLGASVVPELVDWLDHEQIEIRFIASHTLEELTGLNPDFPHFATMDQLNEHGWLTNAREQYHEWFDQRQ